MSVQQTGALPATTQAVLDGLEMVGDRVVLLGDVLGQLAAAQAATNAHLLAILQQLDTLNRSLAERASGHRANLNMDSTGRIKPDVTAVGETCEGAMTTAMREMDRAIQHYPAPAAKPAAPGR